MANIPESPVWVEGVKQIETTDKVLGGPDGVVNQQAKNLADRTAFLKQQVEAAASVAADADTKADSALAQIADAELAMGNAADSAAEALAHKNAALAAKALAEAAKTAAQAAESGAAASATGAAADRITAGQKAAEAQASATAAVNAASAATAAKDTAIAARDDAVAAAGMADSDRIAAEAAATAADADRVAAEAAAAAADADRIAAEAARDALFNDLASSAAGKGAELVAFKQAGTGAQPTNVQTKLREFVSVKDFGAVGDGVTDDTAAFKLVEATSAQTVDLAGKTYVVTHYSEDTTNGIFLTKDYRNGVLIVSGARIIFDSVEGAALSGASTPYMPMPSTIKQLGLYRSDENNYYVWRPLGGRYWQRSLLTRSANTLPFNWAETYIWQVLGYITADESACTYGTPANWSSLTSGSVSLYVNGRVRQANFVGNYVDISYTGSGDLFVVFVGRTSGNHVAVTLNGDTKYLTLPSDGSGNRYFDSYTSTDLQYKQVIQIASGVPEGTHTIRLTVLASKNAGNTSGLNRFMFNALSFESSKTNPWDAVTASIVWASGQAVKQNQECQYGGRFYYASADGTTGATPPTHTSGSVSDGSVTWVYRSTSSYSLVIQRVQATGSQLEYAYQIKPTGASSKEDVGGFAHGNETQTAAVWRVGGAEVSLVDGVYVAGDSVCIQESITATHSQIGGGSTPVVLTKLRRNFLRQFVEVSHKHDLQIGGELGWFYAHMWPLIHYNSGAAGYKTAVTSVWSPCGTQRVCSDYYYDALNPPYQDDSVEMTKDYLLVATGDALLPDGTVSALSSGDTGLKFSAWLAVSPESVNKYRSKNRTFASKSMNPSNANPTTTPTSSMIVKMYFMRYDGNNPTTLQAGESIECSARYGFALIPS